MLNINVILNVILLYYILIIDFLFLRIHFLLFFKILLFQYSHVYTTYRISLINLFRRDAFLKINEFQSNCIITLI